MDNPPESDILNPQITSFPTTVTGQQDTSSSSELLKGVDDKKRIAQLEHEIFTVCKQLDERCEKLKETQEQNAVLKERVTSLEEDMLQKSQFIESLVQNRDIFVMEKTQFQNDKLSLERRKEELETQISKLTNEKRRHLDELDVLRNQCESLKTDKFELQSQLDDFRSEKAALAYDKEQWSREKEILLMSKQWYMNEISNREQSINQLRIDMIREKSSAQREITQMTDQNNELEYKVEQLTKSLEERRQEFTELQEKFKKVIDENSSRINELEAEMRTRERLAYVYKEASEVAEKEIEELKDSETRLEILLKEKEELIGSMATELETTKVSSEKILKEKDEEIKRLSEEVTKSTELLNAGFRLNRPDEELYRLSPAAAAASSLLKSGMSLTSIYAEHCKVVGEYEKKCAEYNQLERQVNELIQDLDARAPQFNEKRKAYDQLYEKYHSLALQNELLSNERQKLQTKSDSLARELTFTQRELERYQREHHTLTLQVRRLLYVIETGPESLHHSHLDGDAPGQYLFSNISELQTKNIELTEQLDRLRDEQSKIIQNYHNTEIDNLKQSCNRYQDELTRVKENYSKQELLLRELTEQRDQYKNLYDQLLSANPNGASSNVSTASDGGGAQHQQAPHSLGSLQADLMMWRTKAERLQETLIYLNDDRQKHDEILNSRIDQQLEQISTMRMTIGKLESDLEFQNKNQQLLAKQIDSYANDLKRNNDQLSDAKRQLETSQFKCDSLTNQLLEKQQELSTLRVQHHSLSDQLTIASSRGQRMDAELEILRGNKFATERVTSTLQGMESFLKRVNEEKMHSIESQLQSALLERDNLRQLVDSLNEQHNQMVNGLKSNLNVACNERDKAQNDCKSIQTRLDALNRLYELLKKDNEKLQNEMEQIQSTDTNIEACKKEIQKMRNTIAYQEKQLAEFEQKCEDLNNTIERKDKQLEEICRLGTDMESSIQYGTLERQRMQAVREQLEGELKISKSTIEELRNNLAAKEIEMLNQSKLLSEAKNAFEEMNSKREQQLLELETKLHEKNLHFDQQQNENQKFQAELENASLKNNELTENNLRLSTELAQELAKIETLTREKDEQTAEYEARCEQLKQSLDLMEQEKLRLQDEIKSYMDRDKEHLQKHNTLYDEIQQLLKQIEFMERLQNTIAAPSPNTSLNLSSATAATFSPNTSRLSIGESPTHQQQHTDRINAIIGYMRTEKQKETELRMNAELDLQRIRAQTSMDQQRILQMESELSKLRTENEVNAKAMLEKEQLLIRLNALQEIQNRYQNLKKAYDDLNQQFGELGTRTRDLEEQNIKIQAEKKNLESRLESATKLVEERAQQIKILRERCDRAMTMASKYSPEVVNSLQSENEKLKSDMTQKNRELDLIKKENERISNEMDVQLKSANTQLATVKQFARKLRDEKTLVATENTKLQEQLKLVQDELTKLRDTATIATSTASASSPSPSVPSLTIPTSSPGGLMTPEMRRRLHDQVAILTKEKEALTAKLEIMGRLETDNNQLRAQLESMQRELDDSTEKCMRIEMVEKAYRNSQQRIQAMTAEIKQLQQENEQLKLKVQELELQLSDIKEKNAAAAAVAANTTPQVVDTFDMLLQRQIPQITFPSYNQNQPAAADPNSVATSSQQAEERPNETELQQSSSNEQQQQYYDSPESPPQSSQQQMEPGEPNQRSLEEAIIDEIDRELAQAPPDELNEGILDIEEGDDADHYIQVGGDDEGQEEEYANEQEHQGDEVHHGGEVSEPYVVDDKDEDTGFSVGNEMPNEAASAGQQQPINFGMEPEEGEFEEGEDVQVGDEEEEVEGGEEVEMTDEDEEELFDEGEEGEGEEGEFYEDEEEEEDGEGDMDMSGEPPRKQPRMHQGNQQHHQQGPSGGMGPPPAGDEDDDDDDIQLL